MQKLSDTSRGADPSRSSCARGTTHAELRRKTRIENVPETWLLGELIFRLHNQLAAGVLVKAKSVTETIKSLLLVVGLALISTRYWRLICELFGVIKVLQTSVNNNWALVDNE